MRLEVEQVRNDKTTNSLRLDFSEFRVSLRHYEIVFAFTKKGIAHCLLTVYKRHKLDLPKD